MGYSVLQHVCGGGGGGGGGGRGAERMFCNSITASP